MLGGGRGRRGFPREPTTTDERWGVLWLRTWEEEAEADGPLPPPPTGLVTRQQGQGCMRGGVSPQPTRGQHPPWPPLPSFNTAEPPPFKARFTSPPLCSLPHPPTCFSREAMGDGEG